MGQTLLLGISGCSLDLIIVVIQPGDVCASELGNLSSRSSNTTTDIKDFVSILDPNLGSEIVFVAGNCLVEGFTVCESAEVERLAPAIFVKIRSKVVVTEKFSKN